MLLYLKTMLRQLVLPPADLLLLAAAGLLLMRRRPRLGAAMAWSALAVLWIISMPVVAYALAHLAERVPALDPSHLPDAQAIVILGGGGTREWAAEYGAAAAGSELLERLTYGAFLAQRLSRPVLVTGMGAQARAMRDTLQRSFGITPRWIDDRSYDTFQNARNSAMLLQASGVQRILLVTSARHMLRSEREFAATGLTVTSAPTGGGMQIIDAPWKYVPDADALVLSYAASYELLGEFIRQVFASSKLRRQQPAG